MQVHPAQCKAVPETDLESLAGTVTGMVAAWVVNAAVAAAAGAGAAVVAAAAAAVGAGAAAVPVTAASHLGLMRGKLSPETKTSCEFPFFILKGLRSIHCNRQYSVPAATANAPFPPVTKLSSPHLFVLLQRRLLLPGGYSSCLVELRLHSKSNLDFKCTGKRGKMLLLQASRSGLGISTKRRGRRRRGMRLNEVLV